MDSLCWIRGSILGKDGMEVGWKWLGSAWNVWGVEESVSIVISCASGCLSLVWLIIHTVYLLGSCTKYFCRAFSLSLSFWLHPWHVEVPRPVTEPVRQKWPEPQQWQHGILNLLSHQGTPGGHSFGSISQKFPRISNSISVSLFYRHIQEGKDITLVLLYQRHFKSKK